MATAPRFTPAGCALALLMSSAVPAVGQGEPAPGSRAVIEVSASRSEYFVGQPIHVEVSFGLEREFLDQAAVQPFGAQLDLPVQLHVPWLDGLPGATPVTLDAGDDPSGLGPSFALNGVLRHARRLPDRVIAGHTFRMHAVVARFAATATGELRVPATQLAFAYATRFEDTLLTERAPLDRVDGSVLGGELLLEVRALPEAGRPFEFSGAVGNLLLTASAEPREVVLGQSLKLRIELAGDVNLAQFTAPRWRDLGGFRVLGVLAEQQPAGRVLTLDLAPVSDQVWQIPAVSIAYFDPAPPGAYRVARSEPIDVRVRPVPAQVRESAAEAPSAAAPARPAPPEAAQPPGWLPRAALAGLGLLLLGALILRRRRV